MSELELRRLRAEREQAVAVEERLREELREARLRNEALEHALRAVRASTSFRFGHAVALALGAGWRIRPVRSAARALLRRRQPAVAPQARGRPDVVLFVAWGAGEARLEHLAGRVAELEAILVRMRPVFVVDTSEFAPITARGYAVEYVIPLEEWRLRRAPHEWGAHVTARMAAIAAEHEPGTVVVLEGDEGRSAIEQGVLDSLVLPSLAKGADNLLGPLDPETETPAALARALTRETLGVSEAPPRTRP
jgi:hypothetical protein